MYMISVFGSAFVTQALGVMVGHAQMSMNALKTQCFVKTATASTILAPTDVNAKWDSCIPTITARLHALVRFFFFISFNVYL